MKSKALAYSSMKMQKKKKKEVLLFCQPNLF